MKARCNPYVVRHDIKDGLGGCPIVAQVLEFVAVLLYEREAMHPTDAHIVCNSLVSSLVVLYVFLCRK